MPAMACMAQDPTVKVATSRDWCARAISALLMNRRSRKITAEMGTTLDAVESWEEGEKLLSKKNGAAGTLEVHQVIMVRSTVGAVEVYLL